MKKLIFIYITIFISASTLAQSNKSNQALKIGLPMPAITLNNIFNFHQSSITLTSLKGKHIVLFFWDENCVHSIGEWPRLIKLQDTFRSELQIFLVNNAQNRAEVEKIIQRQNRVTKTKMSLPWISQDKKLSGLFPTSTVPHLVWIDASGKYLGATGSDELTELKIKELVQNGSTKLQQKGAAKYVLDYHKPLFIGNNGGPAEKIQWQVIVAGYSPNLRGTLLVTDSCAVFSNTTLITMMRYLFKGETNRFGALNLWPTSQIKLEVRDTSAYLPKRTDGNRRDKFYTFHLYSARPKSKRDMKEIVLSELKHSFGVSYLLTKQERTCIVLTASDTSRIQYKEGPLKNSVNPTGLDINNITLSELVQNMLATIDFAGRYPIVDETGFNGKLGHISIEANLYSIPEFAEALSASGLTLSLQTRTVDVLTIYETDFYKPGPKDQQ